MDHSYSESELSLSPSQILERLQVLRQLQLMQRGKLQKQRLEYQETPENASTITEIVSHFTNSTSYNTFRSLLLSPQNTSAEASPRIQASGLSQNVQVQDLIDGVQVLNLSQESEFILSSPLSTRSKLSSGTSKNNASDNVSLENQSANTKTLGKKVIALDEMPILSPKQDFETLLLEKLKNETKPKTKSPTVNNNDEFPTQTKKPFLRRGTGMFRFGLKKQELVIQKTNSLPWRKNNSKARNDEPLSQKPANPAKKHVEIVITEPKDTDNLKSKKTIQKPSILPTKSYSVVELDNNKNSNAVKQKLQPNQSSEQSKDTPSSVNSSTCEIHNINKHVPNIQLPTNKHPLLANKGKTWAAVLSKEQDDFLRQLKQSNYYKNFVSPAKSTVSDMSCDENLCRLRHEREAAEQNMFELIENKVTNESFNLESSFFNKFLKRSMECSGESTPLIMQKCLSNNPELMHIFPNFKKRNDSQNSAGTCNSDYTDCCDTCSSVSSCCSCKTVEEAKSPQKKNVRKEDLMEKVSKSKQREEIKPKKNKAKNDNECHDDTVTENDSIKAEMAEMNAKLVATSELLKDRLHELEDEIETFRKENATIAKMREEIDVERQKFYEEKSSYEQKFNEEKILSEYYLAEEKEKLSKQKQMYDKYVREMRGRLNKKDKDEIINLKKEICDLKEEIRIKDAKSTSTIARLRNQLKVMEKEKTTLQEQVEKLKKENRRIQHSNEISRRLTNIKYLEQINKKLNNMAKEPQSAIELDNDMKYKAYEIERQSRSKKVQPANGANRPRAKSVPNLNITSRYAKYFSQRDVISQMDRDPELDVGTFESNLSDNDLNYNDNEIHSDAESVSVHSNNSDKSGNNLERMYMEKFLSTSPKSDRSSLTSNGSENRNQNPDAFFIRKSNSRESKSPATTSPFMNGSAHSKSPLTVLSNRTSARCVEASKGIQNAMGDHNHAETNANSRPKSPISILSNKSSSTSRTKTLQSDQYRHKLMTISPEPTTSKTSLNKTELNPTEIKKSDGSRELRYPNGNVKYISADKQYSKFMYYNGDVKENFYNEGRIKYYYAEAKTHHTTHADGLEVLEFPDGQVEKRYKDGSTEIRLPNGSVRYFDPKNEHVREEWRFRDGTTMTISAQDEKRIVFSNGQVEVHAKDHKRREFPDGTVKLVYNDGTSETRYSSGRVRIKDKHGNLIMDSASG